MTDQALVAQVEQLRARQDQVDHSLVTLADVLERLIDEVKTDPVARTPADRNLQALSRTVSAVKQNHQGNREK